jgi:hypothetical protein
MSLAGFSSFPYTFNLLFLLLSHFSLDEREARAKRKDKRRERCRLVSLLFAQPYLAILCALCLCCALCLVPVCVLVFLCSCVIVLSCARLLVQGWNISLCLSLTILVVTFVVPLLLCLFALCLPSFYVSVPARSLTQPVRMQVFRWKQRRALALCWRTLVTKKKIKNSQPHNLTTSQSHNLTTSQPHNLTTSQPHNLTTSQPHNLATAQPHNLTTSQPHNLTTSQPHNLTTSQPHNLTTFL